ncbi:VacJ family lipoprotein [Candidatus Pelagibacter ubique]|nr:VacJ family lipoprotein [Candidatus Pelagibacter ubique]
MKKILITSLISLMLATNVSADTDGENNLSKKNSGEVKDCFENVNRATFKFNQVLDGVIFEPVAKAYRILPSPVRAGTGNALDNLSTLVTIPNNILQGEFKKAGVGPGCYLVLPVLGPSTVRDTAGSFANILGGDAWYNVTVANDTQHFSDFDYYASRASSGIDFRAKNIDSFENLEKNSIDFYASVRSLYLQDRQQKIANSNAITETQNDSDWEEIEAQ